MAVVDTAEGIGKHERAYRLIRERILAGRYAPGERLVIDGLAAELGISQVPVREAIRRLEAEGRIVYRHNAGARVAPLGEQRDLRIGVHVGETGTDAVLMAGDTLLATVQHPAGSDLVARVATAIVAALREGHTMPGSVTAVLVGTSHLAHAFNERQLAPVACLRLGVPGSEGLPPLVDWPDDLRGTLECATYLAHGGHEFDGRAVAPLQPDELRAVAVDLQRRGIRSIAVSATFSPVATAAERHAAAILQEELPDLAVTLSHQIGGLGLLERENAAIINAALHERSRAMVADLRSALRRLGMAPPLYLTRNDGTLMTADRAARFPVLTFFAGQATCMRGAGSLSGLRDAVVVACDVGAIHVGALVDGFPRETRMGARIGGVRASCRVPDVIALRVGGGTSSEGDSPRPVGAQMGTEALVSVGRTPTGIDLGPAAGPHVVGFPAEIGASLRRAVERAGAGVPGMPVVITGDSAWLASVFDGIVPLIPEHHPVSTAVGAAIAPVSGEVDRIVSLAGVSRREALAAAVGEAVGEAVAAGADPATVQVAWAEDVPLAYLPGDFTHVRAKAIGALAVAAIHDR